MKLRIFLKIIFGLLLILAVAVGLFSLRHPIVGKWVIGTARLIGKPINATVYTDGQANPGIKVFHVDKYWGSAGNANCYLLVLSEFDTRGMLKFININLNEKWIGRPVGAAKDDYDFIMGRLFQSETGGLFAPWQDDMKGFAFDPQLSFSEKEIKFNVPPNRLKFESVKIELE